MRRVLYFLNPVVIGASSLLLIPALVVAATPGGWAQLAVGQSIGAFGAVLVSLGWGITGPSVIANLGVPQRAAEYEMSLVARLLAFGIVAPVVAVLAAILTTGDPLAPAVAAAATCAIGVGPSWFYVGTADPGRWFVRDTVPRASANFAAAALAAATGAVVPALALSGLGIVVGVVLATRGVRRGQVDADGAAPRPSMRAATARIASQAPVVVASSVTMLYAALPVVLVNQVAPGVAPTFALLDRLHKQAQSGLSPIIQIAQHHVARGDADGLVLRARRAAVRTVGAMLLIGGAYALLAPFGVRLLGAGQIEIGFAVAALSAAVIVVQVLEQFGAKALLAAIGRVKAIAMANIAGAVVGLGALIPATVAYGVGGALAAIVLGYVVTICVDVIVFVRARRERPLAP